MGNKAVLGLVVVAALIGVFFLLGGTDLFSGSSTDVGREGGGADGSSLIGVDGAGETSGEAARGKHGPTLFGRAREDRVGSGGLAGRVMDFKSGEPVVEARLTLAGKGYGGEAVAEQVSTDASGYFSYAEVPAGDRYVLKVSDSKGRQRTLSSQSVDRGGDLDVGTIWLGKRGTLRGRVVDESGAGLVGADVQLHPGGSSMLEMVTNMAKMLEQLDKDAEPIARTESKGKGMFEFANVAPGPFTLIVRAPGHRQDMRRVIMAEDGAAGGEVKITVGPIEAITGVVVDEADKPIAGARVACLEKSDMESVFYGRQFSETDGAGRFSIESPPASGEVAVIVSKRGYPTLFAETEGAGEQRFTLVAGTEITVRIHFRGSRRPVEGASLMAMTTAEEGFDGKGGVTFASARTDAQGEARFFARQGALQMLFFSHEEHGTTVFSPMLAQMGAAGTTSMLSGPEDVTIGAKARTFEFELGVGITISGRVTDDQDKPVVGARCMAMGAMGMGSSTRTDKDGRYELKNQGPPVRMVLVSKPGYLQKPKEGERFMGSMTMEDAVMDVTMLRAASVSGVIKTADGKPAVGARVKAGGEGDMAMLSALTGGGAETITNDAGRYVLDGVQPGKKVRVLARLAGYLDAQTDEFEVAAAGATQAPELTLQPGMRLELKVLRPDGRGARGARIEVDIDAEDEVDWEPMGGFGNFAEVRAGAGGKAEVRDVPAGEATITAHFEGDASVRARVPVPTAEDARGPIEVILQLRTGVVLKGIVQGEDGQGIANASVGIGAAETLGPDDVEDWVPPQYEVTDKEGRFELKNLLGIQLKLEVTAEGYKAKEELVTPGLGEIVVRLEKQDASTAERLAEIDKEVEALWPQIAAAKDDASREALNAKLQALWEERSKLNKK